MKPKKTPKRGKGRPRNPVTDRIASELAVTKRQARNLAAESETTGMPVEDMKAARLRKLKLEGDRIEYLLEVTKGKHIAKEKVEEEMIGLGMAVKAQLFSWVGALPGRLEGLSAAQMVPILEDEINRILKTLSDE
jgi:hypothetical protein